MELEFSGQIFSNIKFCENLCTGGGGELLHAGGRTGKLDEAYSRLSHSYNCRFLMPDLHLALPPLFPLLRQYNDNRN